MVKGQARKRLGKRAKKGFRGFPLATIAFYGPDDSRATKLVVGIILEEDQEPAELRRWFTGRGDIREDPGTAEEVLAFIDRFGPRFNWSSQHLSSAPIAAPHQGLRRASSSRASCAAWR